MIQKFPLVSFGSNFEKIEYPVDAFRAPFSLIAAYPQRLDQF